MIQEKLNSLRPYVTGLRFVKDLPVVDLVLKEGWNMFESDKVSYKPSSNNKNYFMVFPKDPKDSIDEVVTHVENVIEINVEKENKLVLLKAKIEELKRLFTDKSLKDLERLKFVFPDIDEPSLSDINISPVSRHVSKEGKNVELPPKPNKEKVLEKEEN